MKHFVKAMTSMLLCASVLACTTLAAPVKEQPQLSLSPQEFRAQAVFRDKAAEISDSAVKISQIKTVRDFNGEPYTVIECAPAGYMIYHPASGKFVETSPSAPSPYRGLVGDHLYYGGPTEYYQLEDGVYFHTVLDETFQEPETVECMRQASVDLSEYLTQTRNVALLDYVANGEQQAYVTANTEHTYIGGLNADQQKWFRELENCGYWKLPKDGKGACGFIGLNMIIAFLDKFKDDRYMDDRYWANPEKTQLISDHNDEETIATKEEECSALSEYLYILEPKDSTTSMHIHKVSRKYLQKRGLEDSVEHTSLYWGLFNNKTMTEFLDSGYPIELFGNLENPPEKPGKKGGHAVVAYRYEKSSSGYKYTCHYGWDEFSEVTIEGTLASMYGMKIKYK